MKERPILFSGAMVRAILDGSKTQTRRVVKYPARWAHYCAMRDLMDGGIDDPPWPHCLGENGRYNKLPCPYGKPGDRLWVRETWRTDEIYDEFSPATLQEGLPIKYEVDDEATGIVAFGLGRIRQSIFMRRWMSRILLEIVSVRVERLQDISEADAVAEGVEPIGGGMFKVYQREPEFPEQVACLYASISYRQLWKSINGGESWDANPFVWVVQFKRVEGGRA
jgi:hypothetical protein